MAFNMAFGRDTARVHFRKDELEGILGELRRGALQKRREVIISPARHDGAPSRTAAEAIRRSVS